MSLLLLLNESSHTIGRYASRTKETIFAWKFAINDTYHTMDNCTAAEKPEVKANDMYVCMYVQG